MGKIFLIRHGEVAWNRASAYVGSTDLDLDLAGRLQAARLANYLEHESISAVYSSCLKRARGTAEIIAQRLGLPVQTVQDLREMDYGEWEGIPETEIPQLYPDIYAKWRDNPLGIRIPGGESFGELKHRTLPTFQRMAKTHRDESIAIVAHKSTNRVILCCLLDVEVNRYRQIGQNNACINIVELRDDGCFQVNAINECCHLLGQI